MILYHDGGGETQGGGWRWIWHDERKVCDCIRVACRRSWRFLRVPQGRFGLPGVGGVFRLAYGKYGTCTSLWPRNSLHA